MIDIEKKDEEFTPAPGLVTSLSKITQGQFEDLSIQKHPSEEKYWEYSSEEHKLKLE